MPQQFEIGQGATALELNLFTRLGSYGWVGGAGVTLGGATSSIECDVASGTVIHDGGFVDVSAATVTLSAGDPQHPRKDLIWVDYEGTPRVRGGVPAPPDPPDETRGDTWSPAPPPATAVDGVPLAEVWVPAGASDTGALQAADVIDRRVQATADSGLRELSADPADEDLVESQLWRNTTAAELRAYFADTDEVHALDTTLVRSLSGPTETVIEDFDDEIDANWRGGDSSYTYDTPAFEGSAAAAWDSTNDAARDYSLPGDGLSRYPESGDTVALAVRGIASGNFAYVAFGKDTDTFKEEYRLRLDHDGTLALKRADTIGGSGATLGSVSFSYSTSEWYIIETEYDGGGTGVHPFRVYSTASGARDTILAEETSPTSDSTYRGRGVGIGGYDQYRIDRLGVMPG